MSEGNHTGTYHIPTTSYRLPDRGIVRAVFCAIALSSILFGQHSQAADKSSHPVGVRVPAGFEVTLYADDKLAHNIYSMTVDAQGRVAVSGPGYVRILLDTDGDGTADTYKQYADGPKTGAQGLYFDGPNLLCTGDKGLLWYRDKNGDDKADGSPELFLKLKTGAEHHAHAIRKGPDGHWYLIAGNFAGINAKYVTMKTSPVKHPEAGTLMRLKPDLTGGEIVAHGYRNPYDFAFNDTGDLFTFDSDGERGVSLPWYRPTRVFHMLIGSHAGWFSRSWKRPAEYVDMPPVLGSFGRGSPTGVACYRHRQFPAKYRNAVFALDWTFGRVIAMPLKRDGATFSTQPVTFMSGVGEFGFAPTDIAVGKDGSLFICVGGRGTRGGVYRIRYVGEDIKQPTRPKSIDRNVWACLSAPQPLSSWSRAQWGPLARKAGAEKFRKAALNEDLPAANRIRAIEILTEMFDGLTEADLKKLLYAKSPDVRARAIWSQGVTSRAKPNVQVLKRYLVDIRPQVRRAALETLLTAERTTDFDSLLPAIAKCLADADKPTRLTAINVVASLPRKPLIALYKHAKARNDRAVLAYSIGWLKGRRVLAPKTMPISLAILEQKDAPRSNRLDAVRQLQIALGDVGPKQKRPVVFDGFASPRDLTPIERQIDSVLIRLAKIYPTGDKAVDYELARLISMVKPYNNELLTSVLKKITKTSHPVEDIHHLIVASRIPVDRNLDQRKRLAVGLVSLDAKIRKRKLKQDLHWDARLLEVYGKLAKLDRGLPFEIAKQPEFGRPGHVIFLSELPPKQWPTAIEAFVKKIEKTPDYEWNNDVIFLLAESKKPAHRDLIRKQFSNFGLRDAILQVLTMKPDKQDRKLFLRGLESGQLKVIAASVEAIGKLETTKDAAERIALFKTARRLGRDKREIAVRDELVKQLQKSTGEKFGYAIGADVKSPQSASMKKWEAFLEKTHPQEAKRLLTSTGGDVAGLQAMLKTVDWTKGDAKRGRDIFRKRSCTQCHGGRRALGPDLAGVAKRFSRDDFFTAILQPSRDVSPRYQTTQIVTTGGKTYIGIAVYHSVDGVTLRTSQNETYRIEAANIEIRRQLNTSVMPSGLLKGLKPRDLADLYAYVRGLSP